MIYLVRVEPKMLSNFLVNYWALVLNYLNLVELNNELSEIII